MAAIPLSAFSPAVRSMRPHHASPPTPGPLPSVGSQVPCTEPDSLRSCCGLVIRGHQRLSEEHVGPAFLTSGEPMAQEGTVGAAKVSAWRGWGLGVF